MPFHELELLAPAGKMDVLHSVVEAGADAVYLGGKRFNMRALRPDFNFADEEIKQAADFLHQRNRKLYITLNNLYSDNEIDEIGSYLLFLKEVGIDALIVQDLGIVTLCEKLGLGIPLHASVQMGIANLEAVRVLEQKGFERVILSKNVSWQEIAEISADTSLGIEYFCHGDLCISHAGQCFMSSFGGGESGNRGRCSKPCRWQYELHGPKDEEYSGYQYFLAHKDLCLYPHLQELVNAGVCSFKIEGRMRSADYLAHLVSIYRRALDRLIENPDSYRMDEDEYNNLQEHRVRDYTAGNLFGRMGREGIGYDGQREPFFISTAQPLTPLNISDYKKDLPSISLPQPELTVQVSGLDSLKVLCDLGVDNVILECEQIRQNRQNLTQQFLHQALELAESTKTKIFVETPRIVSQNDLETIRRVRYMLDSDPVFGVIVNDLGSFKLFKDSGLELWAGYGLNTFNHKAASLLQEMGVSRITASLEIDKSHLKSLLGSVLPVELMVHGSLPGMVSDYCVIRAAQAGGEGDCGLYCSQNDYELVDRCNQKYKIITDYNCRNYLLNPFDLCLFPHMSQLLAWGVRSFRINGQYYSPEKLAMVVAIYREASEGIKDGQWNYQDNYSKLLKLSPEGLTVACF
ncbi:MAG: peptidase U32 [Firmicutes bacterium HGW-Firmicutes-15]|nr:MAG: peptidase U32 [Firmicutes bacterium HGW-Firmicutes-15]